MMFKLRLGFPLLLLSLCYACSGTVQTSSDAVESNDSVSGDTTAIEDTGPPVESCVPPSEMLQPAITGSLYWDGDMGDQSLYRYALTPQNDAPAEPRIMRFLSPDGERLVMSCDDGSFGVPSLSEGVYMMIPQMNDGEIASTKNVSHYTYEALKAGQIDVVTIGDSVPVVGGKPTFTEVLKEIMQPFGTINANNIAVGGTISEHWVPGTDLYENSLKPLLPETDLVVISLGGNDLLHYVNNALSGGNIQAAIDDFEPFVIEIMDRVLAIVEDIHSINPEIDVVYCLYPNYADSDMWKGQLGFAHSFVSTKVVEALDIVRASIPAGHRFILMDLYGATEDLDLDALLYDQLHFNTAGQEIYAEEIFRALGGARIGDSLGMEKNFGLYKPDMDLETP